MPELIERVAFHQNRMTLDLTEWLIAQKFFPIYPESGQVSGALLQCWARLLVQSTIESIRLDEPALLADFFVVLRKEGESLYEPQSWLAALGWLYCYYQNLIEPASSPFQSLNDTLPAREDWKGANHPQADGTLLQRLNLAITTAVVELEVSHTRLLPVPDFSGIRLN